LNHRSKIRRGEGTEKKTGIRAAHAALQDVQDAHPDHLATMRMGSDIEPQRHREEKDMRCMGQGLAVARCTGMMEKVADIVRYIL